MRKDAVISIVGSEPVIGKEAEYNEWYNKHISDLFGCRDLKKTSRYHRYDLFAGDNGEECARYLAIYEFDNKNALAAFRQCPEFAVGSKDFEKNWPGIGNIIWGGAYEPHKFLERKKGGDSTLFIVATDCRPEKATEYNQWYSDIHLPMLFEFKGITRASRYNLYEQKGDNKGKSSKYLAIYEFDSKEDLDAFLHSPEIAAARPDWDEKYPSSVFGIKLAWSALYEPIKSLEKYD